MVGTPPNDRPDCFWRADLLAATTHLVEVIREVRPQVVVTYDDFGGYGHPDHIQAHRVAMYGGRPGRGALVPPRPGRGAQRGQGLLDCLPEGGAARGHRGAAGGGGDHRASRRWTPRTSRSGSTTTLVTAAIDGSGFYEHKLNAMRAHATQISLDSGFFALSNNIGSPAMSTEYFRLVRGQAAGPFDSRRPRDGPVRGGVSREARCAPGGTTGREPVGRPGV